MRRLTVSAPRSRPLGRKAQQKTGDFLETEAEGLDSSVDLDTMVLGVCQGCDRNITGLHRVSACPQLNCTTRMHTACAVDGFPCHLYTSETDEDF